MDDSNTPSAPVATNIPPEIRTYLENILSDANISSVDEVMQEELIAELFARFDNFLTAKIIDNLPPEHIDEFIKMNEDNLPDDQIQAYLMKHMPNAEDQFARFFIEFRERYLGNILIARSDDRSPASNSENNEGTAS